MIIVQLKGGLGNQLFQYAAGLSLAMRHNVEVKVDITQLQQPDKEIGTSRYFELENLEDPPEVATVSEINALTRRPFLEIYLEKFLPSYKRIVYNEKRFEFDKNFYNAASNIYLKGYRQSEQYFSSIESHIRSTFHFKPTVISGIHGYLESLVGKETVSIHIRRGDYTNHKVRSLHGTLEEQYYQDAIDKISSALENPVFLIFSDSIDWVKKNIKFTRNVEFVSGTVTKNHYEDFFIISRCKHNIIANSSFSWWAAWLNPNPVKIVIAPKKWFNNAPYNTKDLIPDGWLRI